MFWAESNMAFTHEGRTSRHSAHTRLAKGWMRIPAPRTNAAVGDKWAKSGKSAILKLPSAIVPSEFNYLLNPNHPDFSKIRIGKPRLLKIDPRLGPMASAS